MLTPHRPWILRRMLLEMGSVTPAIGIEFDQKCIQSTFFLNAHDCHFIYSYLHSRPDSGKDRNWDSLSVVGTPSNLPRQSTSLVACVRTERKDSIIAFRKFEIIRKQVTKYIHSIFIYILPEAE